MQKYFKKVKSSIIPDRDTNHEYDEDYLQRFKFEDKNGKFRWQCLNTYSKERLDKLKSEDKVRISDNAKYPEYKQYSWELNGVLISNVWTDINQINPFAAERVGYPTQKPEALLERIIKASSNEGDVVLDPFCGCGTAVAVSQQLNRKWIGIDITYLSIDVIKKRFEKNGIIPNKDFVITGTPMDVHSASKLAETAPFQFEIWAVSQLNATPTVKTGDKGVDGVINFVDISRKDKIGKGIISVKGGKSINPAMVRDLKGTVESQNGDFGILITLVEPTKGMIEEAVKAGHYEHCIVMGSVPFKIPKIQIVTVAQLLMNPIPIIIPQNTIDPFRKPDIKKGKLDQEEIDW